MCTSENVDQQSLMLEMSEMFGWVVRASLLLMRKKATGGMGHIQSRLGEKRQRSNARVIRICR